MRNQIFIDKFPVRTVKNMVLVNVEDTFTSFKTKAGVELVNLTEEDSWADSSEFNITEFIPRHGTVEIIPEVLSHGSFNYTTPIEIQKGDIVFWSVISFQGHIPLVYQGKVYLLVDYHELIARERNGNLVPLNGMGLFSPVEMKETLLAHTIVIMTSEEWILERKPDNNVLYDNSNKNASDIWEIGDKVRLLVRKSPYKLEGTIRRKLEKEIYACPMNFIICTC